MRPSRFPVEFDEEGAARPADQISTGPAPHPSRTTTRHGWSAANRVAGQHATGHDAHPRISHGHSGREQQHYLAERTSTGTICTARNDTPLRDLSRPSRRPGSATSDAPCPAPSAASRADRSSAPGPSTRSTASPSCPRRSSLRPPCHRARPLWTIALDLASPSGPHVKETALAEKLAA